MTSTVRVSDVTKAYGRVEAVRGASFTLGQGELVALIGHNGAGKTTLMKLMLGLIRPTSGAIEVLGDNPAAGEFAGRRQLGYLPENVSFDPALTGREQEVAEEFAVLDRVGRLQLPQDYITQLAMRDRVRLGLEDDHVTVSPVRQLPEPVPESESDADADDDPAKEQA